jgi:Mn-dependent DtxR family transcriptional regulator
MHLRFVEQVKGIYLYIKDSKDPVAKRQILEEFSYLSDSSLTNYLKNMVDVNIITRIKRGYYTVTPSNRKVKY